MYSIDQTQFTFGPFKVNLFTSLHTQSSLSTLFSASHALSLAYTHPPQSLRDDRPSIARHTYELRHNTKDVCVKCSAGWIYGVPVWQS